MWEDLISDHTQGDGIAYVTYHAGVWSGYSRSRLFNDSTLQAALYRAWHPYGKLLMQSEA